MATVAALLAALAVLAIIFCVFLRSADPSRQEYPVRGIDVSEHQGDIAWEDVARSGFSFAFIKATEGMTHRDAFFSQNWDGAAQAGIIRGAYHFFTFRSSGRDQARNFIETVPIDPAGLPSTIDIEFSGNSKELPGREEFRRELEDFISEIERHYLRKPVLYVDYDSYEQFIMGAFADCAIWIRDLRDRPRLQDDRPWLFWQYSASGRVPGIEGPVDLNVFNGDPQLLLSLPLHGL